MGAAKRAASTAVANEPMPLGKQQFASRVRILIGSTTRQKQGGQARMVLLEILLGVAGIVSTELVKPEGRIVAGIAKQDRTQGTICIHNP